METYALFGAVVLEDRVVPDGAVIVENGGLTSHAAVVGISMGIPVIVGAVGASDKISDGELITVDSRRGIVYHGASNAL